jgi:glycosyltransferase involved in cell wall biosynthesis
VIHDKTGYIVSPKDEQMLADKIIALLDNDDLRLRFGNNGHKLLSEWTLDKIAEKHINVYNKAINPR